MMERFEEEVTDWRERAACGENPDVFDATIQHDADSRGYIEYAEQAKQICRTCGVINQCLELALVNNELYGVWGGKTTGERRALMRRARRRAG